MSSIGMFLFEEWGVASSVLILCRSGFSRELFPGGRTTQELAAEAAPTGRRGRSTHAEQRRQFRVAQVAALQRTRCMAQAISACHGALAPGVEVDHLRQAQAARDGVGQVQCGPLPGAGAIWGGRHGYSPL